MARAFSLSRTDDVTAEAVPVELFGPDGSGQEILRTGGIRGACGVLYETFHVRAGFGRVPRSKRTLCEARKEFATRVDWPALQVRFLQGENFFVVS